MKLVLLVILSSLCASHALDISSATVLEQTSKLDKAKEIFDNINDSEFIKTIKATAKWGLPLLESVQYFAKVILGGMASESKELTYMKEQFKILNNRMDVVDNKFEEVKKLIDWNVVKVQYSTYEMSINVLHSMIAELTDVPSGIRQFMVDRFVNSYNQLYHGATEKLYESLVFKNRIFSENLEVAIKKFTNNHRRNVEQFFMGNIKLILKGIEVETFYFNIKNLTNSDNYWNNQWNQRIQELTKTMEQSVNEITSNWHKQFEEDTETFNVNNYQKDNKNYLESFYTFLNDKFPWRDWFVIIYNPISGDDNHYVSVYDGIIKFRARNHNIVVGSRDKNNNRFNQGAVQKMVDALPTSVFQYHGGKAKSLLLSYVMSGLPDSHSYTLAAVIEWGAGVWYMGSGNSRVYRKWDGQNWRRTFNIIVMG